MGLVSKHMHQKLQQHRAVLPAIAWLSCLLYCIVKYQ